jgi:hypothetical protein
MAYAVHTRSCTYLLDDGVCRWTLAPTGVPVAGADRYLGAQFVACLDVREIGGLVGELRIGAAALFARSENGRLVLLRTPSIEFVEHRDDGADAAPEATAPLPVAPEPSLPAYAPYAEPLPVYVPRATAAPPAPAPRPYAPPAYAPPAPPIPATPPRRPAPAAPVYVAPAYRAPVYAPPVTAALPAYPVPEHAPPAYDEADLPAASTDTLPLAPLRMPLPVPASYAWPRVPDPTIEPEIEPDGEFLDEGDVEELVTFSEVTLTIPLYRPDPMAAAPLPRRNVIGPGRRLR